MKYILLFVASIICLNLNAYECDIYIERMKITSSKVTLYPPGSASQYWEFDLSRSHSRSEDILDAFKLAVVTGGKIKFSYYDSADDYTPKTCTSTAFQNAENKSIWVNLNMPVELTGLGILYE